MLDHRALAALESKGLPWFNALCATWKKRTGYDPVFVAEHLALIDRRESQWNFWPQVAALVGTAIMLVTLIILKPQDGGVDGRHVAVIVGIVCWFVLCFTISQVMRGRYQKMYDIYPAEATWFGRYLSDFLEWTGKTPDDLEQSDGKEFPDLAQAILEDKAFAVIKLERMARDDCPYDWGRQVQNARQEVKSAHACLKALGIVHEKYDGYYWKAEQRFTKV
jgi:hypothetical protein